MEYKYDVLFYIHAFEHDMSWLEILNKNYMYSHKKLK